MPNVELKTVVRRVVSAALLLTAALAVNHSATLAWGGADAPDGTRYKVSPVGISHVLQPRQTVSPVVLSGWRPEAGDSALRAVAPGGGGAYSRLRSIYPLLQASFWLALVGAIMALLPTRWRASQTLSVTMPGLAALAMVTGVILFMTSPKDALAVLKPLEFGYGGTLGFMLVSIAPLLSVGAMNLFVSRFRYLPILALLGFNLIVWYYILVFLAPIAALLLILARRYGKREAR